MIPLPGRLGPYEVVAPLGAGGMGEVYRARDTRLGREVAVKVLPEPFANDPDRRVRFEREVRAVVAISHPNILAVHDYGEAGGVTYAVMELLEGETLRSQLTCEPLPWAWPGRRGPGRLLRSAAQLPNHASAPPREYLPRARAAAEQALRRDDTLAEAHASLGMVKYCFDWKWAEAEGEFRRAIELNPNYATAHHWYAYLLMLLGRFEEALAALARAREVDPLSPIINATSGFVLYFAHRYDEAIEQSERALAMDAGFSPAHYFLGLACEQQGLLDRALEAFRKSWSLAGEGSTVDAAALAHCYALAGRTAEAEKIRDDLARRAQTRYVPPYHEALISLALGDTRASLEALEKAYRERDFYLIYLKVDPRLDPLRGTASFTDLLRPVGLAE